MTFKSLGKWCTVATVVALFLVWGSQAQQQSAWQTQVLAEGPDEPYKRLFTPDIAVVDNNVYVSFVDQATDTVWLLVSTNAGAPDSFQKILVTQPSMRVMNTTVASSGKAETRFPVPAQISGPQFLILALLCPVAGSP